MGKRRYAVGGLLAASGAMAILGAVAGQTLLLLGAWLCSIFAVVVLLVTDFQVRRDHDEAARGLQHTSLASDSGQPAVMDPVTGLQNDEFFNAVLIPKVATARRRLWPVTVVLIRLSFDNSIQGQIDNDQLIVKFAVLLSRTVREADIVCRLSNLVFGLILDDTDEDGGAWTAERIQIAQSKYGDDRIAKVSAGVASYPTHGMDPATILSKATEAMDKAVTNLALPGLGLVIVAPQGPND